MDKQTLSNYGWIVISVLVLSVLIALATPFGTYVKTGVENTTYGIFNTEYNAFNTIGVELCKHNSTEIINESNTYTGDIVCVQCGYKKQGMYVHNNIIPEGGVYYVGVTSTNVGNYTGYTAKYEAGDRFPAINTGDVYVYGDYEYRYKMRFSTTGWDEYPIYAWGARVLDVNAICFQIPITEINNQKLGVMISTYINCKNLITSPIIPKTVQYLQYCFSGCENLIEAPTLPDDATHLNHIFQNCKSLKTYNNSKDADGDFTKYRIPSKCNSLSYAFQSCTSIKKAPNLKNTKITNLNATFLSCSSLEVPPAELPITLNAMSATFSGCISLKTAPNMSNLTNCTYIINLFNNCTSLTGKIVFNTDITDYHSCFDKVNFKTQKITLTGNCPNIDIIGATGINYCDNCNGYCTCGNF